MNRKEKIESIQKLERQIEKQNDVIRKERARLKNLEDKLFRENVSEIPILLFTVRNDFIGYDNKKSIVYYNIYYYPDLDKFEEVKKYEYNSMLRKTVDLRNLFENKILFENNITYGLNNTYQLEIASAVSDLRKLIDDLFKIYKINSWDELRNILCSSQFTNVKVLRRERKD